MSSHKPSLEPPEAELRKALEEWRASRERSLTAPDGFLALTGLSWLAPGENEVPGLPGRFRLGKDGVSLEASPEDGYLVNDVRVSRRRLSSDAEKKPDRLVLGTRIAMVIVRGGEFALRVWDTENSARRTFPGLRFYPFDPDLRIDARWEEYPAPRAVVQPSAGGPVQSALSPGRAHFRIEGKELALEPVRDQDHLLFVFRDSTAPGETYGGGRFLYADPPIGGRILLDFNRAFSPPCAFTPYATCPLPEPHNVLEVRIAAGERMGKDRSPVSG